MEMKRYVIQARLLGLDKSATKRGRENEYAIEVVLSDESQYTMFRNLKGIVGFHTKLMNKFKVESGYFKKVERVIPECPIKQTIFGPQRSIRDDKSFGRLLNYYLKEIPALPAAVVKSELVTEFFSLKDTDLDAPGIDSKPKRKKKHEKIAITDDTLISGPLSLKSYTTVADFMDKKTKFSFKEGTTVQVLQKDPGGWWRVDAEGMIGWAPASYLIPLNETDLEEEAEENENLIEQERVGTRYISISAYQASRDDELSFVRGAVVKVLKKFVDGWWLVRYNGGEGFVPGAMFRKFDKRQATLYVKKIKRNFSSRGTTRIVPTVKPKWMNSSYDAQRPMQRSLVADSRNVSALTKTQGTTLQVPGSKPTVQSQLTLALAPVPTPAETTEVLSTKGTSGNNTDDEAPETSEDSSIPSTTYVALGRYDGNGISFQEDEEVKVMDNSDNDWWFVTDSLGAEGWAPASYMELKNNRSSANTTPTTDEKPEHKLASLSLAFINDTEDDVFDDLADSTDSLDIEDCYIVTKDHTKEEVDELDLLEGQVVCVIDDSDKDVWYVNADGQEGWVPSDILQLMTDEDTESSRESTPATDLRSAESSEISDDEHNNGNSIRRRTHVRKSKYNEMDDDLSPSPRPRSMVITSPSVQQRGRINLSDGSDSDATGTPHETVQITIDNQTIEDLEREAKEADRQAEEAKLKAQALKERLKLAKQRKHAV